MREGLKEPPDFVGNLVAKLIAKQMQDEKVRIKVSKWKMRVLLETNYYPIMLRFDNGLTIDKDDLGHPTLKLKTSMDTIIEITKGTISPLGAILRRRIRVSGLFRHPIVAYRIYQLITAALGG